MSTSELMPIAAAIDNREDWAAVTQGIERATGLPLAVSPDGLTAVIGAGLALMFDGQKSRSMDGLRGSFAAPVVAQCQANHDGLLSGRPRSVTIHLAAGRVVDGKGVVRVHLEIHGERQDGSASIDRQFWDIQVGAQVTVAQPACPNCGAPITAGELVCSHCGTDVRHNVDVPVVVSRLELY